MTEFFDQAILLVRMCNKPPRTQRESYVHKKGENWYKKKHIKWLLVAKSAHGKVKE